MKRYSLILTVLALLLSITADAQQTHIIQRGENAEIIARKYGVTLDELKQANPDEENYYAGMKITIPPRTQPEPQTTVVKPKRKKGNGFFKTLGGILAEMFFASRQAAAQQRLLNYGTGQAAPVNGSYDYLLDPRYAMQKVQQKQYDEYLLFTGGGKTMSYDEYQQKKAQEAAQWEETKRMLESVPSSVTESSSENEKRPFRSAYTRDKDCGVCGGTGKCNTCNGRGWYDVIGIGSGRHTCPNCPNNIGRCSSCNGTGKM